MLLRWLWKDIIRSEQHKKWKFWSGKDYKSCCIYLYQRVVGKRRLKGICIDLRLMSLVDSKNTHTSLLLKYFVTCTPYLLDNEHALYNTLYLVYNLKTLFSRTISWSKRGKIVIFMSKNYINYKVKSIMKRTRTESVSIIMKWR